MSRLENDYAIVKSIKPMGAKPNTKEELNAIVDNLRPISADISEEFTNKIIDAIKTSPIVRRNIKKALN